MRNVLAPGAFFLSWLLHGIFVFCDNFWEYVFWINQILIHLPNDQFPVCCRIDFFYEWNYSLCSLVKHLKSNLKQWINQKTQTNDCTTSISIYEWIRRFLFFTISNINHIFFKHLNNLCVGWNIWWIKSWGDNLRYRI